MWLDTSPERSCAPAGRGHQWVQLPSPAAGICRWPGPAGRVPGLHGPDRRKRSGEPGRRPGAAFPAAGYAGGREDPAGDVSVGFLVGDLGCAAARRIVRIKIIYTVMRSLGTGPTAGPDPVLWRIAPILLGLCATTPTRDPHHSPCAPDRESQLTCRHSHRRSDLQRWPIRLRERPLRRPGEDHRALPGTSNTAIGDNTHAAARHAANSIYSGTLT